jgi:N-acetylmuramoyl-L-alanine amidase
MRTLCLGVAFCLLSGCATGLRFDDTYRSDGHRSRVRAVVIHYTVADFDATMRIMKRGDATYHYVVSANPPTIYRIVDESRASFHAGRSSWRGYTNLNESSIGISLINRGSGGDEVPLDPNGWEEYSPAQLDLAIELVKDVVNRHLIRPEFVVGHSDIAPQRKVDPGPRFPWKRLADAGLIPWPDPAEVARRLPAFHASLPDVLWFQDRLAAHGFAVPLSGILEGETQRVIAAFQMKYRPSRYDGLPDAETAAMLDVLTSK